MSPDLFTFSSFTFSQLYSLNPDLKIPHGKPVKIFILFIPLQIYNKVLSFTTI